MNMNPLMKPKLTIDELENLIYEKITFGKEKEEDYLKYFKEKYPEDLKTHGKYPLYSFAQRRASGLFAAL